MEPKKLRRSYNDSIIGGVAGGLGEYFATDPLIFRILFVVLLFTGGGGFFIYLLMWIFIPKAHPAIGGQVNETDFAEPVYHAEQESKIGKGSLIGGSILIVIGLFFLLENFWPWLDFSDLWPVALVIAGLAIVKMNYAGTKEKQSKDDNQTDQSA